MHVKGFCGARTPTSYITFVSRKLVALGSKDSRHQPERGQGCPQREPSQVPKEVYHVYLDGISTTEPTRDPPSHGCLITHQRSCSRVIPLSP